MQPLDAVYLQILKNLCTDLSEPVPLDGVDTVCFIPSGRKTLFASVSSAIF